MRKPPSEYQAGVFFYFLRAVNRQR
jgi:hypothetical protein